MIVSKNGNTLTADIHGMTAADAKTALERLIHREYFSDNARMLQLAPHHICQSLPAGIPVDYHDFCDVLVDGGKQGETLLMIKDGSGALR